MTAYLLFDLGPASVVARQNEVSTPSVGTIAAGRERRIAATAYPSPAKEPEWTGQWRSLKYL